MNSLDALRKMVDHYPGGRAAVAARLGKTDEVLRKELSGATSHKLGLVDAEAISEMCAEVRSEFCDALANRFAARNGGFIRLPVLDMPPLMTLHKGLAEIVQEMSHVVMAVTEGDADNVISDNDLDRSVREIDDARRALQVLEQALRSKNAAGKPAHLRAA